MNLLIIGHKGSGKTHIGKLLAAKLGVSFTDSSTYCFNHVVYPVLKDLYGYTSPAECMAEKDMRRKDWFDLISEYNAVPDRLTLEILAHHQIYVGMRNRREFEGSKHHFDYIIWIDAAGRVGPESPESMELRKEDADIILGNSGPKKHIDSTLNALIRYIDPTTP